MMVEEGSKLVPNRYYNYILVLYIDIFTIQTLMIEQNKQ